MRAIVGDAELELALFVGGMHLSPEFGSTYRQIEADGFLITERLETLLSSDTAHGVAATIGLTTISMAGALERTSPDLLLLVGDRTELLGAASAALAYGVPIAHVSGGELTEGAVDNQVRHALTKMSHLHFVAMDRYRERVVQMGEEPWRVFVTGDPGLDAILADRGIGRADLEARLGVALVNPIVVVTYHPPTLDAEQTDSELSSMLRTLEEVRGTIIVTASNADRGGRRINERLRQFANEHQAACYHTSLGPSLYYSLLRHADLMVGNSSSAIWEAPSFELPAVNIGTRQEGRIRAANAIDADADHIREAVTLGLKPEFRESLRGVLNPYGDGRASERIVDVLRSVDIDDRLIKKRFYDACDATTDRAVGMIS
jgi:UDP-hydrolysing UDP-N-acetyl-D-glucosamine 2-epimerase